MSASIRIFISLMILQIVTPQGGAVRVAAAEEQGKKVRRSSTPAAKNKAKQVRELMNAAANGDTVRVLEILNRGLNVNVSFERDESEFSGMTVLMVASSRGYYEMVEALIKRGASVNLKRYTGDTPLLLAAGSDNVQTVSALLKAGADPNVKVFSHHAGEITPLNRAINLSEQHRIEIEKGTDVNARDKDGATALMTAEHRQALFDPSERDEIIHVLKKATVRRQ